MAEACSTGTGLGASLPAPDLAKAKVRSGRNAYSPSKRVNSSSLQADLNSLAPIGHFARHATGKFIRGNSFGFVSRPPGVCLLQVWYERAISMGKAEQAEEEEAESFPGEGRLFWPLHTRDSSGFFISVAAR